MGTPAGTPPPTQASGPPLPRSSQGRTVYTGVANEATVTHLLPGAEYACALTVVNLAGESEPSEAVYFKLPPPVGWEGEPGATPPPLWVSPGPSEPLPSPYGLVEASPSPYPQSPWRRPTDARSDGLHEGWGGIADGVAGANPAAGAAAPYAATDAAIHAAPPPTNPHDAAVAAVTPTRTRTLTPTPTPP